MGKDKKIDQEGIFTIMNDEEVLIGIIRRDPNTGKHLVYLVTEARSEEIADLIGTKVMRHEEKKTE